MLYRPPPQISNSVSETPRRTSYGGTLLLKSRSRDIHTNVKNICNLTGATAELCRPPNTPVYSRNVWASPDLLLLYPVLDSNLSGNIRIDA